MAKLKLVRATGTVRSGERTRPRVTLVYGMRLFPAADVTSLTSGTVRFTSGEEARVTLHVIDGTREEVKRQLAASVDAFFDIYGGA
jgi:hypothetical protein